MSSTGYCPGTLGGKQEHGRRKCGASLLGVTIVATAFSSAAVGFTMVYFEQHLSQNEWFSALGFWTILSISCGVALWFYYKEVPSKFTAQLLLSALFLVAVVAFFFGVKMEGRLLFLSSPLWITLSLCAAQAGLFIFEKGPPRQRPWTGAEACPSAEFALHNLPPTWFVSLVIHGFQPSLPYCAIHSSNPPTPRYPSAANQLHSLQTPINRDPTNPQESHAS